jgi:hydrogenase-4 component B
MVFVAHIFGDPVGSLLWAIVLLGLSGLPGLLLKRPGPGQLLSVVITLSAAVWGMAGALRILGGAPATHYLLDWQLPFGPCELAVDPLSALFLIPLLLAAACCSLYGAAYLPAAAQPVVEKKVTLFSGLLLASMASVLVARNGVMLLMAWELMALSSWLLLMTYQQDAQVERAGMVYLLATHTGTMALFVLFSLLRGQTGSFVFPAAHSLTLVGPLAVVLLLAALIGFGAKAGIMPLHIWLPGAHANAPSHVSALMSGIMLKVGLYGILRTVSFFHELPVWFGWLVLLLGVVSAVTGIALASYQRDLKRLLACSSIENIGIICIGLGMALVGMQSGNQTLLVFGLVGAFMHILNHALFKPLLFLGSGVIIHASGTRQIDRMGGLSRILPRTAPLFLVGSLAICGLPPLNGFVGELFLYFGAFSDGLSAPLPLIAFIAPVLALVGGLAVITFVKLYGAVFLGSARDSAARQGHEAPFAMVAPMALLAGLCLLAGVGAPLLLQLVEPVVIDYAAVSPALFTRLTGIVPLPQIALMNGLLLGLMLVVWLVWRLLVQQTPVTSADTWGCGYLAPTPRIQYTGSSFADLAAGLFAGLVGARTTLTGLSGHFPAASRLALDGTERILDRMIIPCLHGADWCLAWLRRMQSGHLHLYILYVFATLFALMVWSHL